MINFQSYDEILLKKTLRENSELLKKNTKLTDYKSPTFKSKDFLGELKDILVIKNPISYNGKKERNELKSLVEIANDYVFTADNFLKMCLILIRIRANIPIIMMGETGCGKTSLIRKLSELQNNGQCLLVIDNIHAGHTNEDIINFIKEKVLPKSEELEMKEAERKATYKYGLIFEEKKLLVFFWWIKHM